MKSSRLTRSPRLVERRERWSLTLSGWGVLLVTVALAIGLLSWRAHAFLALTDRTETQFLVVEGWVPNYALEETIAEFRRKPYHLLFSVGGDILNGVNVEEGDNHAGQAAKRLAWLGMNPEYVQAVPSPARYRDRTYASAIALREWIDQHQLEVKTFNLVTVGTHARRSRLLFEKAFAGRGQVGIISVENREYDPGRWWSSSEGVKEVISEGVGYLYARFLFSPTAGFAPFSPGIAPAVKP